MSSNPAVGSLRKGKKGSRNVWEVVLERNLHWLISIFDLPEVRLYDYVVLENGLDVEVTVVLWSMVKLVCIFHFFPIDEPAQQGETFEFKWVRFPIMWKKYEYFSNDTTVLIPIVDKVAAGEVADLRFEAVVAELQKLGRKTLMQILKSDFLSLAGLADIVAEKGGIVPTIYPYMSDRGEGNNRFRLCFTFIGPAKAERVVLIVKSNNSHTIFEVEHAYALPRFGPADMLRQEDGKWVSYGTDARDRI